jgi:hypothetical protein
MTFCSCFCCASSALGTSHSNPDPPQCVENVDTWGLTGDAS